MNSGGEQRRLDRVRRLARLYDAGLRIPGTRFELGLDPLVGLVPGIGDVVGAGVATYIVLEAARCGVSSSVLLRMLVNLGIDAVVGAVPVIGDVFDAGWQANIKNVSLLERHLADPRGARQASGRLLILLAAAILFLCAAAVTLAFLLLRTVASLFSR